MRMIIGLDRPTSGSVTVGGRPYGDLHFPLNEIGALLDAKAVDPARTAAHHLLWLAKTNGIVQNRIDEVLGLVGLTDVASHKVGTFSLGMHQRLGVAAALLGDPAIVMFDEPINGLDPDGILWIRTLLRTLAGEGRTVFLSSHLMAEMAQTADDIVVIGQGRIIADGPLHEIVGGSTGSTVTVRSRRNAGLTDVLVQLGAHVSAGAGGRLIVTGLTSTDIGDAALASGIALEELTPRESSLEDAFLGLTHDTTEFRAAAGITSGAPR
jgi:ABC-2 type transport system ATP-binding protein